MKVLHTGTLGVKAGGPAMSTYNTLLGLQRLEVTANIYMYPLSEGDSLIGSEIPVHYAPSKPIDSKLLYSPQYKKGIKQLGEYDIYHAQGVWQYTTYALADIARQKKKPYLITPRGMLYPQDIAKSNKSFKLLSLRLKLLRDLNQAACVQVTCEDEMNYCRQLGVTSPIAIIPNPVEIKEYTECKTDSIFRLGYLGRLSPRKNVESLLYAFAELKEKQAELLIIGGGDEKYESFLRKEVQRLKLDNVHFAGFLSGADKDKAIASCSVLAMPSEFENLGNVILEGLVRGIPCIATYGSPWKDLSANNCGWWVEYSQEAITTAIKQAMNTSAEELKSMGKRGKELMSKKYSIPAVANQMISLYKWILRIGKKPFFIYE